MKANSPLKSFLWGDCMKKFWITAVLAACILSLSACSGGANPPDTIKAGKEVLQPYRFSAEETRLLTSLGMESKAHVFAFKAPEGAKALRVNIYRLKKDGAWQGGDGGEVALGENDPPSWKLEGNVALLANDDHSFTYRINALGSASYTSSPADADTKFSQKAYAALTQEKAIELGKEIPVFLSVCSGGTSVASFGADDYFSPEKLTKMDLVQAVTVLFTDGSQ